MIDEENEDEEILKKGITLKSALKNLLVIFFILLGAAFIYFGYGPDQWSNLFIGFFLICIGTTIMQVQKSPPEPIRQTLTILLCNLCGLTKVRNYEQGDFVFQKRDDCEKCNQSMEVKQIYSVKLKKPTEPNKKKENPKLKQENKE
ncbi:MAG: hypothetical protein EU532_12495 [Promethearchaeota archaeon]|nr:MAG: hypothetical protein EU532_12495 [Candidatus Lokiarchaeota archaeon]